MTSQYCEFLFTAEGGAGPVQRQQFAWNEQVAVRDLSTRCDLHLKAADVSPYRHTLYISGQAFRILNVIKHPPA